MPDLNQADQVAVVQKQDSSPPVVNAYPRCPPHPPLARSELITAADKSPNNLAEDNSSYGQSAEHAVSVESKNHRPSRPNPTVYPGDLGSISNFLRTPQPNPFKPANDASYHVNSSAHSVELGVGSHEQRSGLDMVFKGVIKPKKSAVDEELSTTSDEQMDISLPKYKTIIPRSKKPQISSQTGMAGKRASRGATPGVLGHDRSGVGRNSNTGTSSGGPRTTATKRKRISEGDKPERYYVEEDSGLSDVQIAEPKHLGLAQAPARPSQAKPALTRPLQSQSSKTRPQPSSLNRNKKPRVAADHEEELRLQETDRQITDLFQ